MKTGKKSFLAFIKERKMGLNDFIQKLASTPHICQHADDFLKIDENQNEEDHPLPEGPRCLTSRSSLAEETQIKPCDFDYLKIIGKGSFGKVLLARHKETTRYYAVKVLQKKIILKKKEQKHIMAERSVLMKNVQHPFLVGLHFSFQTTDKLYFVLDYVNGGELFYHLQRERVFLEPRARFYAAEIASALGYLHSLHIVYRDLKPENILLDSEGHIRLTDFGFAKKLSDRTWTLCGTPEYLAPEVIQSKGHGRAVDWWALGILVFEMLAGYPPFFDDNPFGIYQKILSGKLEFPRHLDFYVKDLIKKFLVIDRARRLGNMKNGADDVKKHRWFKTVDWEAVPLRKMKPPIVPKVSHDGDTSNFDVYPEDDWKKDPPVPLKDLEFFKSF